MVTATNPTTGENFELPETTEVNEIVTDPTSGEMFEVISIENNVATLEAVSVGEDWGE